MSRYSFTGRWPSGTTSAPKLYKASSLSEDAAKAVLALALALAELIVNDVVVLVVKILWWDNDLVFVFGSLAAKPLQPRLIAKTSRVIRAVRLVIEQPDCIVVLLMILSVSQLPNCWF